MVELGSIAGSPACLHTCHLINNYSHFLSIKLQIRLRLYIIYICGSNYWCMNVAALRVNSSVDCSLLVNRAHSPNKIQYVCIIIYTSHSPLLQTPNPFQKVFVGSKFNHELEWYPGSDIYTIEEPNPWGFFNASIKEKECVQHNNLFMHTIFIQDV